MTYRPLSKVADWDFDDGFGPTEEPVVVEEPIQSRVVVLKHMFTLQELKDDPSLLLDLKEDVREEAETMGDVTNVVLYDVSCYVGLVAKALTRFTGRTGWHYDDQI